MILSVNTSEVEMLAINSSVLLSVFSLRFSAYLRDLCVETAVNAENAENRRESLTLYRLNRSPSPADSQISEWHTTTHRYCQNRRLLYQRLVKTRLHPPRTLDKTQAPCPGNHQNNAHRSPRCSNCHPALTSSSDPASI